jgi:hypothetical protein
MSSGWHYHAQTTWVVLTLSNNFDFWTIRRGYVLAILEQRGGKQCCARMACMHPVVFDPFDLVRSNAQALHIVFLVCIRAEWVPSYNQWGLPIV